MPNSSANKKESAPKRKEQRQIEIDPTFGFHINAWMTTKLGLAGNELLIYAIVLSFTSMGKEPRQFELAWLAAFMNISKTTVQRTIASLINKGLIVKEHIITHYGERSVLNAVRPQGVIPEIPVQDGGVPEMDTPLPEMDTLPIHNEQVEIPETGTTPIQNGHHKIDNNNKENNINNISTIAKDFSEQPSNSSSEIDESKFEEFITSCQKVSNPKEMKQLYIEAINNGFAHEKLMEALPLFIEDYQKCSDKQFAKKAEKFFTENHYIRLIAIKDRQKRRKDSDSSDLIVEPVNDRRYQSQKERNEAQLKFEQLGAAGKLRCPKCGSNILTYVPDTVFFSCWDCKTASDYRLWEQDIEEQGVLYV